MRLLNFSVINQSLVLKNCFSSKSNLFLLRKKTGLPIKLCKESLQKNDDNLDQAFEWLSKESVRLGLNKAEKLSGREMNSGLLGLMSDLKTSAVIEINCETDFVSRNSGFQSLLDLSTSSLFKQAKGSKLSKIWSTEELGSLSLDNSTVNDALLKLVNEIGENIQIRRGFTMDITNDNDFFITNYSHLSSTAPVTSLNKTKFGKYVSLIKYKSLNSTIEKAWSDNAAKVTRQLCQHIIGMNPNQSLDLTEPEKNPDYEKCLWHQKFFLDENITVKSLLEENKIALLEFVRFECGTE